MSYDNFSIKSDTDSNFNLSSGRQMSPKPTIKTASEFPDLPKIQSDARKSFKRKSKHKKKTDTLSPWSTPIVRRSSSRSRQSTTSLISFKGKPVKSSVIRKIKSHKSERQPKVKVKTLTKTIAKIIEPLSRSDSMKTIFSFGVSENAEEESEHHKEEDTLSQNRKFLLNFENLPDLSDISSTLSLDEISLVEKKDCGRYVENIDQETATVSEESSTMLLVVHDAPTVNDEFLSTTQITAISELSFPPLDGEDFATKTETTDNDFTIVQSRSSSKSNTESVSLLHSSSGGSFDLITSRMQIEKEEKKEVKMDAIDEMMQLNESMVKENITGSKIFIKLKKHETTIELVEHFLAQLINDTVHNCESKDHKVNSSLTLHDLMKAIDDYRDEQKLQETLNRRIIEHFYRQRKFEPITPTKSEEIYKDRLQTALNQLDHVINVHNVTFDLCKIQIEDLEMKEAGLRLQLNNQIMELERIVRNVLNSRPEFQKLPTIAEDMLNRMSKLRKDVSKKRLKLILKQHEVTEMKEKINKLEIIGEGLSVSSYISTQEEVKRLAKKISERNVELKRYAIKARSILHMLAHFKTKGVMIREDLKAARKEVAIKSAYKTALRTRIYELTKDNNKLRQDLNEIKTNGTIQQYPLLIDDYDKTVDSNKEKRCIVEDLRIQHEYLVWRIENLEKRFTRKQDLKSTKSFISSRTSKLLSKDMSKAISRAISRYGSDDNKFKEFISSIGIDLVSYEMDDSNSLTTLGSSSEKISPSQA